MIEEINNDQKLDYNIINIIKDNIIDPFIVCDKSGFITISNDKANDLFNIGYPNQNILELLGPIHGSEFSDFLQEASDKKTFTLNEYILSTKNSKLVKCNLIINTLSDQKGKLYFVTFVVKENNFSFNIASKVNVVKEVKAEINDENILAVIDYLKSNYPLTFLEKEEFRKQINKIDVLFWLKDADGRFVVVNEKFAGFIGIQSTQIEKEYEHNFVPAYVRSFYESIEKYITSANSAVIMENIPIKGNNTLTNYRTIEIPLSDAENNLIAVIGVAKKSSSDGKTKENVNYNELFKSIKVPLFVLKSDGNIAFRNSIIESLENDNKILYNAIIEACKNNLFSGDEDASERLYHLNDNYYIYALKNVFVYNENSYIIILHEKGELDIETFIKKGGKMFDQLVKYNPEPIYIYDKENLRFLEVNNAALELYGYRKDEFLQMDLTDLYTPDDIQTLLSDNLGKEGEFKGPYRQKTKDGTSIFVEISRIGFKYNNIAAHFNLIKDVTDILELGKQNQVFKSAFDNTDSCLFITDASGFITFVNNAALETFNYTNEELEGTSFISLVAEGDRAQINNSIFNSEIKNQSTFKTEIKKKDKSQIGVELVVSPVFDYKEDIESFTIIIKETKKTAPAAEFRNYNNFYPKPVEINRDYFSGIFHEILTPINVILGFAQEIVESIDNLTEEQKEASDIITQSRNNLLSTMNSIIEYSEMTVQKEGLELSKFTIVEILEKMQEEIKELNRTYNHTFGFGKVSSSIVVNGDKEKFHKLLDVILKIIAQLNKGNKTALSVSQYNADSFIILLKTTNNDLSKILGQIFSGEEQSIKKDFGISKITLRLANMLLTILKGKFIANPFNNENEFGFALPLDISAIVFEEEDITENSARKPAEDLFEFDSFEEIKSNRDLFEEKPDEESKSGYIELSSFSNDFGPVPESDRFSSNDLVFSDTQEQKPAVKDFDLSRYSCMYIEDQLDSQMLFKNQMKGLKNISFAVSFEEAIPALENKNFDFIVLDINLQGEYNGLDALKLIHKMPKYLNTPIIAVTAYLLPGDREKFIAAGFNEFISKPVFRTKIIDVLRKVL